MDWPLRFFRWGVLVCIVGATIATTQFDIGASIAAVWNQNPTSSETATASFSANNTQSACLTNELLAPSREYPSHCYPAQVPSQGLPRDFALVNIRGFLLCSGVTFVIFLFVIALGIRMARDGPLEPISESA
jgi:hypothetical protein